MTGDHGIPERVCGEVRFNIRLRRSKRRDSQIERLRYVNKTLCALMFLWDNVINAEKGFGPTFAHESGQAVSIDQVTLWRKNSWCRLR